MKENRKQFPFAMTLKALIIYIISIIIMGLFFFFVRGDLAGKMLAFIVCPMLIGYLIYAYLKEKKADKNAGTKKAQIIDGSYFESSEWHEGYVRYINEHPFERPKYPDMKKDLLIRFHRREYVMGMLFTLFLMFCCICVFFGQSSVGHYVAAVIGIFFFGIFFYIEFSSYIGMPVRRRLKSNIDYNALNASYRNSQLLTYKKNGLAFGTSHLHGFTEKKIFAIDYRFVEGISRKIVRLKSYEDGIYSKEEYQHFAIIHVKPADSDIINDVEIELNEYQVQMAIDKLSTYKPGEVLQENLSLEEKKENEAVI